MSEKETQQIYMEFQVVQQQMQQIQQQIGVLEQQNTELANLKDNLGDISKLKEGTRMLVPLGSAIFLDVELKNSKEVVMGVGSNITVKKDIGLSQEVIDTQVKELCQLIKQLEVEQEHMAIQAQEIQKKLIEQSQKK